ncbi:AraC family transcriptional regulator [Nocardia stercoris]|uniref:AraC family transcriptional regulator n=1 Tax=Nocardia stercoris TaxID=2483361 RepID=UPI00131A0BBD|nr:AraC family transcriptional regulator [Nocardia stercoris]
MSGGSERGVQRRDGGDPVLHDARIPPMVLIGVFDLGERMGLNTDSWLAGTAVARSDLDLIETRLSFAQASTILRRALRMLPAGAVGISVGTRDVVQSWGLLGLALRSCATLGDAFELGLRLHQAAGSLVDCEGEYGAEEFSLVFLERCPEPEILPFLCEEATSSILALLRLWFGEGEAPKRIEFGYPAPFYAHLYDRVFRCPITYDADVTRMYFEASMLERPGPTPNRAQLAATLAAMQLLVDYDENRPEIVVAIEGVLREDLHKSVTAAVVADRLAISTRTLQRRLADSGETFQSIRDRVRHRRATSLLRDSDLPIAAVAAEVGYSDGREFRRAYQRWTGMTPSAERADARAAGTVAGR